MICDPAGVRDSTQIVVRWDAMAGLRSDIASEFTVSIRAEGSAARIIGSPVGIKELTDYLARLGVALP